jgi:O-antigen ligase
MGLQMLRESPIWGVGFSNFLDHHEIVAHNSFVHCFAELGLIGYFLWLATIVATFWLLQRAGSIGSDAPRENELTRWAGALELSLASFLVGALFLSRTYGVSLFFLLGLSAAFVGVARRTTAAERRWSIPALRLITVTGALVVSSIVTTYLIVRLGR